MKAIDRKLLRDLWQMRSQVVTVALVVASAFSGFAGSIATYYSLDQARERFYESARFGNVFADIKRAPREIERSIAAIPGVSDAQTTVVFDVTLDVPGVAEPLVGRMIGLPEAGAQRLDKLVIRRGRAPERGAAGEVVVSEGFASTRDLGPGKTVTALINGRKEALHIVGVGLSPDYIYATRGGAFPDDRNFGVFWIARERLAAAYNMEGAFNHVTLLLAPGSTERAVVDALDRLLEPYGGLAAHGRDEQLSNRILNQEIDQWKVTGTLIPSIFLGVAAFLLNVVLNRQVATQREQIAALKALGYGNGAIAGHYLFQVVVIVVLGIAIGIGVAYWWGGAVTALYADFFHFPSYRFFMPPWVMLIAGTVTLAAAIGGAMGAVRRAAGLAPAEAMRPPSPGRFGPTLLERAGMGRLLTPAMRMVIRNLERRPLRALLATLGMASAVAIIISGVFWRDALEYMMDVQFEAAQPGDAEIALVEPLASRSLHEVARMPGVLRAEGSRAVPVRLVAGHRYYRTALLGIGPTGELRRLLDANLDRIPLPAEGILLTDRLADRLGVRVGDTLVVEALEGKRTRRSVPVAGVVRDLIGLSAYMDLDALYRLMGESETFTGFAVRARPVAQRSAVPAPEGVPAGGDGGEQGRDAAELPRDFRAQRSLLHDDPHGVRIGDRDRRRLQQRAHRAAGARMGAREPARSRVHARRGLDVPAGRARPRARRRDPARVPAGLPAVVGDRRDEPHGHDLDPDRRRAAHLRVRRARDRVRRCRQRADRARPDRPARPRRRAEDAGVTMSKIWVRRGSWLLGGAIVVGLLVWAFAPRPVEVETATVTRGPFRKTVDEDGKSRVRERYVVSAPVPGRLLRVDLKAGAAVEPGTLVARLAPAAPAPLDARTELEYRERLGAAEATLLRSASSTERAGVALEQAKAEEVRAAKLADQGFTSRQALENAQREVELKAKELAAAKFDGHAAEHQVAMAQAALARYRQEAGGKAGGAVWDIRSPVAGRVLRVLQESEAVVAAGAPILEVGDPRALEVVVDVLTADAAAIRPGAAVELDHGGGAPVVAGRVRMVEPAAFTKISALGVEEQRVNVVIDFAAPATSWGNLGDAHRVDARITVDTRDDAVLVPVSALFRHGDGWAVFVVSGSRARLQPVATGPRNGAFAVVAGGLDPGTPVIAYPGDAVADGVRVTTRGTERKSN